ncbi:hypothetical protein A3J23_04195 [Candidatus Peregrinibacteria bacterium RIFCSPLOWO2_02_FULL_48_14]|nr:MAG: hypothetical protein A3J23_04195 [Candidatus Peregrinibacteria bacterium RIFCSPLOWO2_02_FULL_48_14]
MNHRASALLLSFFMMTLLILVAISVSVLVVHDSRTVRTLMAGSQATYAAEGMSELGLYEVKSNLPGYEPTFEAYAFASLVSADAGVSAREDSVPCTGQAEWGDWGVLAANESVQLPLFAQTAEDGTVAKNTSFVVEFYVGDEEGETLFYDMTNVLTTQDVLRWKILGLYTYNGVTGTKAISEYIPLDQSNNRFFEDNPTQFGPGAIGADTRYTQAKYYSSGFRSVFFSNYPIQDFLNENDYNYLVMTNIIQGVSDAYIYYRLNWSSGGSGTLDKVVCEYAQISSTADATLAEARQELVTLVKQGESLPVFDFVLYHTSGATE